MSPDGAWVAFHVSVPLVTAMPARSLSSLKSVLMRRARSSHCFSVSSLLATFANCSNSGLVYRSRPVMERTSSSALSRPPMRFEIVPPVARRRTFGSGAAAWAGAGACGEASPNRGQSSAVKSRMTWTGFVRRRAPSLCRRLPLAVDDRQPAAQLSGGFDRCLAVEGHQGRRSAGRTRDLCPPFVDADARDFDVVLAPVDDLFEAVNVHGSSG